MRSHIRPHIAFIAFALVMTLGGLTTAVCTGSEFLDNRLAPFYKPLPSLDGRFTIAGSNTMFPLMTKLAAEFKRLYPHVVIGVEGQGSKSVSAEDPAKGPFWEMVQNKSVYRRGDGGDVGHHVSMQVHIMASSRKLSEEEFRTFRSRYGYDPMEIPIALDAVVVYANAINPIIGLTLDEVDALFSRTRHRGYPKEIQVWGGLISESPWKDATIHLYGRNDKSGTHHFFRERALLKGQFLPEVKELPGAASVIEAVSKDSQGIGYSGLGLNHSQVRIVPIAEEAGMSYVAPSAQTIVNHTYPLWRTLYLYVNHEPGKEMATANQEFLRFIRSQEGQSVVRSAGFFPLFTNQQTQATR